MRATWTTPDAIIQSYYAAPPCPSRQKAVSKRQYMLVSDVVHIIDITIAVDDHVEIRQSAACRIRGQQDSRIFATTV